MLPLLVQVPVLATAGTGAGAVVSAGRLIKQADMNCIPRSTMELFVHTCKHLSSPRRII